MEIRQMRTEEADKLSHIYASSWKKAYKGILPEQYLNELSESRWIPLLKEDPTKSYVLLDNSSYIGTASICSARDQGMGDWDEIISIYLLPAHFGKGYGKVLLNFCIIELKNKGFSKIYLWTFENNLKARAFYEKCGFAQDGQELRCEIGGKSIIEVRYIYYVK